MLTSRQKHTQQQQTRAHADRGIRQVENIPMIAAYIEIQKIGDRSRRARGRRHFPPRRRKSMTGPTAERRSSRSIFHSIAARIRIAATENSTSAGVCQRDESSENMPNATPGFSERTRLKKPGITGLTVSGARLVSIIHFDQRSAAKTPSAITKATTRLAMWATPGPLGSRPRCPSHPNLP